MTLAAEQLDQFKVVVSFILTQNVLRILKVSSTCNKISVMIQIQIQISFGFVWMWPPYRSFFLRKRALLERLLQLLSVVKPKPMLAL